MNEWIDWFTMIYDLWRFLLSAAQAKLILKGPLRSISSCIHSDAFLWSFYWRIYLRLWESLLPVLVILLIFWICRGSAVCFVLVSRSWCRYPHVDWLDINRFRRAVHDNTWTQQSHLHTAAFLIRYRVGVGSFFFPHCAKFLNFWIWKSEIVLSLPEVRQNRTVFRGGASTIRGGACRTAHCWLVTANVFRSYGVTPLVRLWRPHVVFIYLFICSRMCSCSLITGSYRVYLVTVKADVCWKSTFLKKKKTFRRSRLLISALPFICMASLAYLINAPD